MPIQRLTPNVGRRLKKNHRGMAQKEKVMLRRMPIKSSSDGQCNLRFSATFRLAAQDFITSVGVDTTEGVVR